MTNCIWSKFSKCENDPWTICVTVLTKSTSSAFWIGIYISFFVWWFGYETSEPFCMPTEVHGSMIFCYTVLIAQRNTKSFASKLCEKFVYALFPRFSSSLSLSLCLLHLLVFSSDFRCYFSFSIGVFMLFLLQKLCSLSCVDVFIWNMCNHFFLSYKYTSQNFLRKNYCRRMIQVS